MSLESGRYYITSADGGFPVGRRLAEDRSLRPKGIYKLPMGTESVWEVEKLANGSYRMKNRGATVGRGHAGFLVAFLVDEEAENAPTEWNLRFDVARAKDGDVFAWHDELIDILCSSAYGSISERSGVLGWVLPESNDIEPYQQVHVGVLIVGPSEPPTFPPNEVFIFKRLDA
ncbi:hypothetical protein GSI_07819 [Ganoderma sinense ZZ0214-1]|uniref:Uncharacterized protein n=1 Tax=Ganoderma sinense ZZ0214-1 TaxID=1077348 RepID=A0A2G8S807_9APHY|nr:hypothetical protein GSI_07819 [Ganoderma sinense ZZ0214-1]